MCGRGLKWCRSLCKPKITLGNWEAVPYFQIDRIYVQVCLLTISTRGSCATLGRWSPGRWAGWVCPATVCRRVAWSSRWCSDREKQPGPWRGPQNGSMTNGPERKRGREWESQRESPPLTRFSHEALYACVRSCVLTGLMEESGLICSV